jgi:hypothetical protein
MDLSGAWTELERHVLAGPAAARIRGAAAAFGVKTGVKRERGRAPEETPILRLTAVSAGVPATPLAELGVPLAEDWLRYGPAARRSQARDPSTIAARAHTGVGSVASWSMALAQLEAAFAN